ncbi:Kunitz/Bovine pancreatic trypsin inhibitor domain protein [Ancylostoma caninum]|uniref:Kunitz/Bovine pancreatic trypsin inhibitor domain protein n=1 Tax=Ancylostoma caninum TaxID=29170 RepID=A0A368GWX5_ANCCA|nr:Kunitz/Bovine pancreatic trypsin inhibitor domain protein [Ancylostoma caninum]
MAVPQMSKCSQPIETGVLCPGTIETQTRYAFRSRGQKCVKMEYGGCGGNDNNFKTEEECRSACLR